MLVIGFPSDLTATNCYVLAPAAGEECVVIDPGINVLDRLAEVLAEHRLRPAAVLATHGHFDHVFSVTPVCSTHAVALSIHPADRYRVLDPISSVGAAFAGMLQQQFPGLVWREPDEVIELDGEADLELAGLTVRVSHAPGHTEGSVMFSVPGVPAGLVSSSPLTSSVFSGDVLFAGSVGRTDLPGGDPALMVRSLREKVLPLSDDTLVLPGHGEATTIGHERATNPFLLEAARTP